MLEAHEVYGVRAPEGTIIVTPEQIPQLVYDRTIDGEEFLGLLIIDPRTGPLLVAMSLSMTGLVAEHMTVTLAPENIDRLRADWESKNGDKRNG
jgi:hypothetical protein